MTFQEWFDIANIDVCYDISAGEQLLCYSDNIPPESIKHWPLCFITISCYGTLLEFRRSVA